MYHGGRWRDDGERGDGWRGRGHRGRGDRGRGRRSGHRNYHLDNDQEGGARAEYRDRGERGGGGGGGGGRGRRGGPPAGLKGREIGMWFAKRSKEKKAQDEINNREVVHMDRQKERHLSDLLHTIRTSEAVPPQPVQSYRKPPRDWFDDEDEPDTCNSQDAHQNAQQASGDETVSYASASNSRHSNWDASDDKLSTSSSYSTHSKFSEKDAAAKSSRFSDESDDSSDEDDERRDDRLMKGEDDAEDLMKDEDEDFDDELTEHDLLKYREENDADDIGFQLEYQRHKEANRRSMEYLPGIAEVCCGLKRNPSLDTELRNELMERQGSRHSSHRMMQFRKKLPSYDMREDIINLVNDNQVTVISGETGCGKTTQVAQFILDDHIMRGCGSLCRVVCTQPRRISAISVAERVAEERGEPCGGGSVGYQIRLDVKQSREQGSILYCTNGILLQWLRSDPYLCKVSHIILDEIHERDLHSDFLMIILKDLLPIRKDLKIILMSATLNAEMFSQYYGSCPMINIPGFTYPVKEYLLEDVLDILEYRPETSAFRKKRWGRSREEKLAAAEEEENYLLWLASVHKKYKSFTMETLRMIDTKEIDFCLVTKLIEYIVTKKEDGAILVFMPGWEDIKKVYEMLRAKPRFNPAAFRILPLHSMMPTVNQREVFERPPPGVRKIIIATNIAETSITIDDIVYVIDCGKIKLKNFDPECNISTLKPEWVAQANAKQRRGRAGRVQPGECYHLYTGFKQMQLADYQLPEMLRTRLEELCLQIKLLKLGKIKSFVGKAMQPPSLQSLDCAINCLLDLNALDEEENLTPLGYHLAKMPVDPHTGKMLLFGAMFSCLEPILTVAASLSFKDAFVTPLGKEFEADARRRELADGCQSDHIMLAKAFQGWVKAQSKGTGSLYCWKNFMSANTLKMLLNMRRQFTELLCEMGFVNSSDPRARISNQNSSNERLVKGVICAGLYPNVGKMRSIDRKPGSKKPIKLSTKTDRSVQLHPKSVNEKEWAFDSRWMVYHLKMKTAKIYLYDSTCVSPYPLLFFGGNISTKEDNGQECITVDDWIVFRSSRRIAHLVMELRRELDKLLEYKITHPGPTDWDPKSKEGALMQAITDLITTEETQRTHSSSRSWDRKH